MSRFVAASAVAVTLLFMQPAARAQGAGEHWVGTWATAVVARAVRPPAGRGGGAGPQPQAPQAAAPQGAPAQPAAPPINFNNQTIREVVHLSIGGGRVRVVLSNEFGDAPLAIGAAHVALRGTGASIVRGSDRALTFAGKPGTSLPAGAVIFSDPVALDVPALSDLAISLYLPGDTAAGTSPLTIHAGANQTNYVSEAGDHTADADLAMATTAPSWYFVSRVEVTAPEQVAAIVALGDSITDGARTTSDTNSRWPDVLARRLSQAGMKVAVLNVGIAGNRILQDGAGVSALARFDRDVASQTAATYLLFLEGINDIRNNLSLTTDELIAAHRQIIDRAHARGLKVIGATLTPFEGSAPLAAYTPDTEGKRQAVNTWIRTSKAYDGVIDFDAAVRDPNHPTQLIDQYQSGDHLHPNDAGYQLMGNAVNLDLFKPAARTTTTSSR
jgi:lysophospholipase L1-like esterase